MENINDATYAPETEETISDADMAAFDEVWEDAPETDGDDYDLGADEDVPASDENPDTVATDDAADGGENGAEEQESAEDGQPEAEPEEDKAEEGHQLYTLKSLNGEKQYSLDDVLKLATKGLDYDGVRQDRDRFRGYEAFLKELAAPMNLSVEELIDNTRARMLIQQKKDAGEELSEMDAMNIVLRNKAAHAAEAAGQKPTEDAEASKKQMIQRFVDEFPDVKADAIPTEVWAECNRTGDLAGAYRKYADGLKDKEIARLNKELKSLKQSQMNRDRSIGSLKTSGAPAAKDPFDEGWDSV